MHIKEAIEAILDGRRPDEVIGSLLELLDAPPKGFYRNRTWKGAGAGAAIGASLGVLKNRKKSKKEMAKGAAKGAAAGGVIGGAANLTHRLHKEKLWPFNKKPSSSSTYDLAVRK
jgi:hypothetical protein